LFQSYKNITDKLDDETHYLSIAYRVTTIIEKLKLDKASIAQSLFLDLSQLESLLVDKKGLVKCKSVKNDKKISWGNKYVQEAFINFFNFQYDWFITGSGKPFEISKEDKVLNDRIHEIGYSGYNPDTPSYYNLQSLSLIYNSIRDINLNWLFACAAYGEEILGDVVQDEWAQIKPKPSSWDDTVIIKVRGQQTSVNGKILFHPVITKNKSFIPSIQENKTAYLAIREKMVEFLQWSDYSLIEIANLLELINQSEAKDLLAKHLEDVSNHKILIDKLYKQNLRDRFPNILDMYREEKNNEVEFNQTEEWTKYSILRDNPVPTEPQEVIDLVRQWKMKAQPVSLQLLIQISDKTKLNLHWLFTGYFNPWLGKYKAVEKLSIPTYSEFYE